VRGDERRTRRVRRHSVGHLWNLIALALLGCARSIAPVSSSRYDEAYPLRDSQMPALTSTIHCPAVASLDSRAHHEWTDGPQIDRLRALDELAVRTRNSLYRMVLLEPLRGEVLVQGGRYFPEPTRAQVARCSLGGAFLKLRGIYIGFRMEIQVGLETIITSDVRSVEVMSSGRAH
jgi:hypothetical protein